MADTTATVKVELSNEMKTEIEKVSSMLSEMRVRQIIREELAIWEKSLIQKIRIQQGTRLE